MDEILEYYLRFAEQERLAASWGQLEMLRTQEVIRRYLPPPPATLLDVGGGPGRYACWLAAEGYEVHLVDPVEKHIEEARNVSEKQPAFPIATTRLGDARSLCHPDASVDVLLLLGPLYHLTEHAERQAALCEAKRVLRPGGVIFAAAIGRFASLLASLHRGFSDDPQFMPILIRDLKEGQHRNPTGHLEYFTTAFFHHPEELRAEVAEAGFEILELLGVEGPAWLARDFERRWADPDRRRQLLELARIVEREPALLGLSPHLLIVARKPHTTG